MQPAYRLFKVGFYLVYGVAIVLGVIIGAAIGKHTTCQLPPPYGNGECIVHGTTLTQWVYGLFGLFIAYALMEIVRSIGIYIARGTKFKDQHTFFMEAMREGNRKKSD